MGAQNRTDSEHPVKTRDFIVAGNWKMHKTPLEAEAFLAGFTSRIAANQILDRARTTRVIFFVPALALDRAVAQIEKLTSNLSISIEIGCQNAYSENSGAFTGENSPATVAAIGAKWLLVGHSERRSLFGETDQKVAAKVKAGLDVGLRVMLCVGETLKEREAGATNAVVKRQLVDGLSLALNTPLIQNRLVIAYEPVWAIGTGKVATPTQASEVHQFLRSELQQIFAAHLEAAHAIPILYGGSVKPDNAQSIAEQNGIDGFLVGGASLEIESMVALTAT